MTRLLGDALIGLKTDGRNGAKGLATLVDTHLEHLLFLLVVEIVLDDEIENEACKGNREKCRQDYDDGDC